MIRIQSQQETLKVEEMLDNICLFSSYVFHCIPYVSSFCGLPICDCPFGTLLTFISQKRGNIFSEATVSVDYILVLFTLCTSTSFISGKCVYIISGMAIFKED